MKQYKRILVKRADGSTYYRQQLVGSDKRDKPSKNSRLGKCYQLSAQYVIDNGGELVHGVLENPFKKGFKHLQHAWVITEKGEVYDPVMDITYPKEVYYSLYHVIENSKYSSEEAMQKMDESGNYGPWKVEDLIPTAKTYKEVSGKYSSDRFKIHKDIIDRIINQESKTTQGEVPEVILTLGGSGSGKSTLLNSFSDSFDKKYSYLDVDDIKHQIPEYHDFKKLDVQNAAYLVHEESSDIAKLALEKVTLNKHHFIFDSTLKDADWALELVAMLKARGYRVRIFAATVPIDVAIKRVLDRAKETGRFVPENIIKQSHEKVSESFQLLIEKADELKLFDTNAEGINVVFEKSKVGEVVHDESLYEKFKDNYKGFTKSLIDILIERHPEDVLLKAEGNYEENMVSQDYADCIISDGEKILYLLRRKDSDFAPACWGLPGGKVDAGETVSDACKREVKEETGLDIDIDDLTYIKQVQLDGGGSITYFAYDMTGESQIPLIVLDSEEHENYEWKTLDEFMDSVCIYDLQENIEDFLNEDLSEEIEEEVEKSEEDLVFESLSDEEIEYLLSVDLTQPLNKSEIEKIEEELVGQEELIELESTYFTKAVAPSLIKSHTAAIGEVHEWSGKKYKKVTKDAWEHIPELSHDQKTRLDEAMGKMSLDELNTLIITSKQAPIVEAAKRLVDEKKKKYVKRRINDEGYLELKSKKSEDNPFADDAGEMERYFKFYKPEVSLLDGDQIENAETYRAYGREVNSYLRSGQESEFEFDYEVFDSIFKQIRIKDDIILHRSVRNLLSTANFFSDLNEGDEFEDSGYVSCSVVKFGSSKFFVPNVSYELVIKVKKGTPVIPMSLIGNSELGSSYGDEYEFLLPRNSKFKVLSKNDRTIELELI